MRIICQTQSVIEYESKEEEKKIAFVCVMTVTKHSHRASITTALVEESILSFREMVKDNYVYQS